MSISLLFNTSASGHCISTSTSMCVHQWFWTPLHLYISTSLFLNTSTSVQCINTLVHQSSASVHCISTSVHQSITWRECRASSAAANLFASSRVWNQVKLGRLWGKIIEWWITRNSSKVSVLLISVWWGDHDFFPILARILWALVKFTFQNCPFSQERMYIASSMNTKRALVRILDISIWTCNGHLFCFELSNTQIYIWIPTIAMVVILNHFSRRRSGNCTRKQKWIVSKEKMKNPSADRSSCSVV